MLGKLFVVYSSHFCTRLHFSEAFGVLSVCLRVCFSYFYTICYFFRTFVCHCCCPPSRSNPIPTSPFRREHHLIFCPSLRIKLTPNFFGVNQCTGLSAHPHIRSSSSCGGGSNQESEKCKKIKKIVGLVGGSDFSRCVSNFFFAIVRFFRFHGVCVQDKKNIQK